MLLAANTDKLDWVIAMIEGLNGVTDGAVPVGDAGPMTPQEIEDMLGAIQRGGFVLQGDE